MNWVKVDEALPPDDYSVLIIDDVFDYYVGWLIDGEWRVSDCRVCIIENVTHWQELPDDPEYD